MANPENRPFIFVSYAHKDSDTVLPILNNLTENNVEIWYDNGIEAGSEWPDYIAQKIMNCDRMLCFVSEGYSESKNCSRELNFAISRNKPILSIYLNDKINMAPGMMMNLESYQSLFYTRFKGMKEFCSALLNENFICCCKHTPEAVQNSTEPFFDNDRQASKLTKTPAEPKAKKTKMKAWDRAEITYQKNLEQINNELKKYPDNTTILRQKTETENKLRHIAEKRIKRNSQGIGARIIRGIGNLLLYVAIVFAAWLTYTAVADAPFEAFGFKPILIISMCVMAITCLFDMISVNDYLDAEELTQNIITFICCVLLCITANIYCCTLITDLIDAESYAFLFYAVSILGLIIANILLAIARWIVYIFIDTIWS